MRHLHSDLKCPVCKTTNETLIVDKDNISVDEADADDGTLVHHKQFDQYQLWGNDLGNGYVYREDVGMHFPNKLYEEHVVPLLGYGCGMPDCEFTNGGESYVNEKDAVQGDVCAPVDNKRKQQPNQQQQRGVKKRLTGLKALKTHLRIDHGYAVCDLCVTNKRDFVSKLARYTPQGLKKHQSHGDGALSGFSGHPLCEFCKPLRFYDVVALHDHLNKEHYKCHICEKQGKPNQFFKDYNRLERHFDREHFLCHEPQCLAARFMVFENEIDLRAHEASFHGTNRRDGGTKIKLEFRVRREGELDQGFSNQNVPTGNDFGFGLNGEAFVPEALPEQREQRQVNEPEISHPIHAARTAEMRAHAARTREREHGGVTAASAESSAGRVNAFPALDAAAASESTGGMLVGWTADGVRNAGGGRLKKTAVGKVTQDEFPSLGPGPRTSSAALRKIVGTNRARTKQPAARGPNFSSVASRPTFSSSAPISSAYASSSFPVASAPDISRNNFPSLGGATSSPAMAAMAASSNPYASTQAHARKLKAGKAPVRSAPPASSTTAYPAMPGSSKKKSNSVKSAFAPTKPPPNMAANNFPSLGGARSSTATATAASSNPYAAAQAHSRKLNAGTAPVVGYAPPASSTTAYPSLSGPSKKQSNGIKSAFAPTKQPPQMMGNVLQFPAPTSTIKQPQQTAQSLQAGKATVESLKQILGTVRYKKLKSLTKDFAMGSTPPEEYVDVAASLFDEGISDEAFWYHIPSLINDIPNRTAVDSAVRHLESVRMVNEMQELEFSGGGGVGSRKKPINYVLPAKKKGANSWGNNAASTSSTTAKRGGGNNDSMTGPFARSASNDAVANKNESKKDANGSKKNKSKKKNAELKALAFGA